jgi:mannose-6-phosphate isomerase-like protein (cupin superfamily)
MADRPAFPGGIGVTHLRVYDTVAPDGLAGGTPHLHTACTEAYAVIGGEGAVQTISGDGYREVPLQPGAFVWFTAGTVHRLVNRGELEIVVLMQNAGLPEAGDMVITFDPGVRKDAEAYMAAATLPANDSTTAGPGDAARARRDAAVSWFVELRASVERGERALLADLYADAAGLVRDRASSWRNVWADGPYADTMRTSGFLDALAAGDGAHLASSSVHRLPPPPEERRMGCCGTLGTWAS